MAGIARSYDAAGNLLDRGDGFDFTYSDANRLAAVTPQVPIPGVTLTANYRHSARGERVAKTFAGASGQDRYFSYDESGRLLAEHGPDALVDPCHCPPFDPCIPPPWCNEEEEPPESLIGGGSNQAMSSATPSYPHYEYVWLDDLPVAVVHAGTLFYVESDHLGTPRAVVKPANHQTVWSWDLIDNPFGEAAPDANTYPFVFNLRYPGQYFDQESGLHYNYFRDYEAGTGRYIQSDPIGLGGGISTYSYTNNSPLRYGDRFGLRVGVTCLPGTQICIPDWARNPLGFCIYIATFSSNVGEGSDVVPQLGQCPNNRPPANDACYIEDDDGDGADPCEEWADELLALRISILLKQAQNPGADYSILISEFRRARATFCANCPHLCGQVPSL